MNSEKICFSSKTIDIAEHENYLILTNRLCYYDDKNLNGVMLPYKGYEESALECAKTLVNMPVQAKYKKINNLDDLGSHEMHILPTGEIEWGTESVGTHTNVEIKEDTVTTISGETKVLPCLFAECRIWKRNKNIVSAIKRLYESENGLNTSWEISTTSYEYKHGTKILTEYEFIGNTFLGSTTTPAYNGTSKTLSLSALTEQELLVAEALSIDLSENQGKTFDINKNQEKEENILKKDENITVSSEENVEEVNTDEASTNENTDAESVEESDDTENSEETNKEKDGEDKEDTDDKEDIDDNDDSECKKKKSSVSTETSSLTAFDLRMKINQACREKVRDWCWVSFMFPEEHVVWCEYDEAESELDYLKFTYSVENDDVTVSDPEKVKLSVMPSQINSTVSELNKQISSKDEIILKSSQTIAELNTHISELSVFKTKFEEAEQKRIEAELSAKKEELISDITKTGLISKEEIETSEELKGLVNNLDKRGLMSIIGERLLEQSSKTEDSVETSESKSDVHVASNLNNEDDEVVDKASIMRNFLRK